MTLSTSAERRVFCQSLRRISSQDGPDTIGEAAMADLSSSSSAAGNSYSINAPHSAFRHISATVQRQVTRPEIAAGRGFPAEVSQSKRPFGSNESNREFVS